MGEVEGGPRAVEVEMGGDAEERDGKGDLEDAEDEIEDVEVADSVGAGWGVHYCEGLCCMDMRYCTGVDED